MRCYECVEFEGEQSVHARDILAQILLQKTVGHFRKIVEIKIDMRVTVYVSGDLRLRPYEIICSTDSLGYNNVNVKFKKFNFTKNNFL